VVNSIIKKSQPHTFGSLDFFKVLTKSNRKLFSWFEPILKQKSRYQH